MAFPAAHRAEAVALALALLSLALLALPEPGHLALARGANHIVLWPLVQVESALGGHLRLRAENADLRADLQRARLELGATVALRRENQELHRLLAFRAGQPVGLLPARILNRDFTTLPTSFLIDAGRRDGVEADYPVVTADGLVGKVVEAGPDASQVMLFGHPEFSASALLVGGDHLEYGVVRPATDGTLQLFLPLRSRSEPGDRIVTSGYGGTFPRGIPIGTVERVREDQRLGLQRIDVVAPVVELGAVTAVFVLTRRVPAGQSAGDVVRLFWPGFAYPPMAGETFGPDTVAAPPAGGPR